MQYIKIFKGKADLKLIQQFKLKNTYLTLTGFLLRFFLIYFLLKYR